MALVRAVVLALLFSSCGSLLDEQYLGAVRLRLTGEVVGNPAPFESVRGKVRLSLFYFPNGPRNSDSIDDLQEDVSTAIVIHPPNTVDWLLYDLPPDELMATTPSGKKYGLGVPYVYVDQNGNGRRDTDEAYAGEAPITAVFYAPEPLDASESPTGRQLEAPSLSLAARLLWCTPRPAEPEVREDCGVNLGSECSADADCGPGTCLRDGPWPWPMGVCALRASSTCAPANAHLWRNHRDPSQMYWLNACQSDRDCRGNPYRCDVANGVCLPIANLSARVDSTRPLPVCQPTMP